MSVGNTAHILLEIDESQDVSKEKYTKDFKPMGATTNVTTVHYGTTWDENTLLEEIKQTNLELERKDGIRRHFRYDWQEIAKYNPDYRLMSKQKKCGSAKIIPYSLHNIVYCQFTAAADFFHASRRRNFRVNHTRKQCGGEKVKSTLPASTWRERPKNQMMLKRVSSSRVGFHGDYYRRT